MEKRLDNIILEQIERAKAGDNEAQSKVVESNLGLVWSIVKRFSNRGHDNDDLFQIGCIGLIKAIRKFDQSFGVKFSTYAVPMIMGEIKRFLRDDGMIKVSRGLKETANKVRITKEIMSKELGREPSIGEIANKLGIDLEDIVMAMEAGIAPESLYKTMYEGENNDILYIDKICEQSEGLDIEDKIALKEVIQGMEVRERQIIVLRYFKEKTQSQVAEMLRISQVQVSRIEKKILQCMKKKIQEG
jgi:RNA polymerase sporulation-specific sigma factor